MSANTLNPSLDLAVIGNCQIAGLVDKHASMVWTCLPRFDSDPAFCSLLKGDEPESGFFAVELTNLDRSEQQYVTNTPILETILYDSNGSALKVVDYAPRFLQYGRLFRPVMMIRTLVPLQGSPQVRVRLRPLGDYGATRPTTTHGSNHIRYVLPGQTMRVTTDGSLSWILEESPFVLEEPTTLILGPDETVPDSVGKLSREFFGATKTYWQSWTRGLSIPFEWQEAVIRAAITLKLCTFEDTGAVIAAITTSIPEAPDSGRNWDYRFCWLRDSYFVVHALNRLGATKTMEAYLRYIINLATEAAGTDLQPVYSITGRSRLDERTVDNLAGYRGMGPVRVGNQAYQQRQNDVFGAVVLASTQYFFDRRLAHRGDEAAFQRLEIIGNRAAELYDKPDAGPWEYRGRECVHTYSSVMCWAACDRLAKIALHLRQPQRAQFWRRRADRIHREICRRAWSDQLQSFTASFESDQLDASMLLLHELDFLAADDPRFLSTLAAIESHLRRGNHLFRYAAPDDFGEPETAFNICTFWYIDALASVGRRDEARELFENMLTCRNSVGLLSEDLDPVTHEPWGNFPQSYSMVGLINAAMRLSKTWEEAL